MMRALTVAACITLATAAHSVAQTRVQFTDHTPGEHIATAHLPGAMAFPGEPVDGSLAPVLEREVAFTGAVDVSLVGATPTGELVLRSSSSSAPLSARVRCFWADAEGGGARLWSEFNCFRAGENAPAPAPRGTRTVYLRAYLVVGAAQTDGAAAGRYTAGAYFRVDAL